MRILVVRFDPRLIQPDDAPEDACGELDLPDDLLELAAQLGEDANYLAERYPAPVAEPFVAEVVAARVASATPARRGWVVAAIGGVAAAAMVAIAVQSLLPSSTLPMAESVAAPAAKPAVVERPIASSVSAPAGPRIERLPWAPSPAITNVSGPELEGLLDLWQDDQQPTETRIEI